MNTQFWWGLAMLPLGAIALAIVVFLPWFIIAWISDRRQKHPFTGRWDGKRGNVRRFAAYIATAQTVITIRGPFGWRIGITRDQPGATPRNPDAMKVIWRIEDAIATAEEEA